MELADFDYSESDYADDDMLHVYSDDDMIDYEDDDDRYDHEGGNLTTIDETDGNENEEECLL